MSRRRSFTMSAMLAFCALVAPRARAQVLLEDLNGDGVVKVLAFGDSTTVGTGDNHSNPRGGPDFGGYPARLQQMLGASAIVVNAGKGGEGAGDGSERISSVLAAEGPDFVIILEGANNVNNFDDENGIVDALDSIVNSVFVAGSRPLLATLTPFCCDKNDRAGAAASVSSRLRTLAAERGAPLVDFHEAFAPGGQFDPGSGLLWVPEGFHPQPHGYDVMGALAASAFTAKPPLKCRGLEPTIVGTHGDDTIHGTPAPDVIHGRKGNDQIFGLEGDDVVCGGGGNDVIFGALGNDQLVGGKGDDQIFGGEGVDFCKGGLGFDQFPNGVCETIEDVDQ